MTNKLTIRTIHKQDELGIKPLIEALNESDDLGYSLTDEWFDYVVQESGEDIFVAIFQDKLIGLGICMISHTDKSQANINIVVHPDYRKQGFGSNLYDKIIAHAESKELQQLETNVRKRLDDAVRFASKRGFQPVLYSWQMELELGKVNFNQLEQSDSSFRKLATTEDGKAYIRIINQCFGDSLNDSALKHLQKDPSIQIYLLGKKDEVIGTTTMQLRTNLDIGYIYDVAIVEEFRRQGLGSLMLKKCINQLKENNMKKASLLVTGENKSALVLYHRLGFREVDTDILMQKQS